MRLNLNNQISIVVLGTKGSGKSNLIKFIIKPFPKVFILDYIYDYKKEYASKNGFTFCKNIFNLMQLRRQLAKRIIFQFPETPSSSQLESLFKILWNYFPNYFFIFEETDRYAYSRSSEKSALMTILNLGRHHGNGWVCVSRRLSRLNLDIISYADYIISFFQHTDNDLLRLSKYMGNIAYSLKSLNPYHFLVFDVKIQNLKEGEKYQTFPPIPLQ